MKTLANEIVRVRINDQLKNDAKAVLESLGLTM
ncbi:type II toxin-antitoxin system RelB/DinJ family antitoxin [Parasutterella muris]|nr:type II toxin-antitoxin system RelB/DinJ family antitoxin [Parasutterella muris]